MKLDVDLKWAMKVTAIEADRECLGMELSE
jgi:hypothetical protein